MRPRIIPCLLIQNGGLVKTVQFGEPKYVGDPINAVRIFNEKQVDELIVLDIDATRESREPDYDTIRTLAAECRMPLCYGGGIKSADQAQRICSLGVEKVAVSSEAIARPELVTEMARQLGSQSVVAVLDVKKRFFGNRYDAWTHNAQNNTKRQPVELAKMLEQRGAGELLLNSIDRDGTMKGYDVGLARRIHAEVDIPLTVLGGAGSVDDIRELVDAFGIVGAAAGSFFVFKGQYRAVLINYLSPSDKNSLRVEAQPG